MNKTMYEINYHSTGEVFSHCSISPITVIREGILPGCTGVSITAIGLDGHRFQGNPNNFFNSKEEAVMWIKKELNSSIKTREADIKVLTQEVENIKKCLLSFTEDQDEAA